MDLSLLQGNVISQGLVLRHAPPLWVVILVIVPAVIGFSVLCYRLSPELPRGVRLALTAFRVLVLFFLALLLMDPAIETQTVERKKALALLLVDVSESMGHKDGFETSPELADRMRAAAAVPAGEPLESYSRLDLLKRALGRPDDPFLDRLAAESDVRVYAFGETVRPVATLDDLDARDRLTAIGRALERILEEPEVKSRPVAGIVVLSDGKNTAGPLPEAAAEVARRRKLPIHTVGVGDPQALRDVELASVIAPAVVLAEDTMVFDLKVRNVGFPTQPVELRLLEDGRPFHREQATLLDTAEDQSFQLTYRPIREGRFQWQVEVRPLPGEHSRDNNSRTVEVSVRRERLKVLYVDMLPRWEYRKLMSFLTRSEEAFETHCLLLSAEAGFLQESSAGLPPRRAFPETEEELFAYDVIIFGDVDPQELTQDPRLSRFAMDMVRRFVENGGGFCMIAGDRFSPQAFNDTPIGEVIPVLIDPTESGSIAGGSTRPFHLRLTEIGRGDPVMQLAPDPAQNERLWEGRDAEHRLEPAWWFARVKKAKPGTRVLAVHESERNIHGPYPLIVAGTYGEGPVVFVGLDETWRWYRYEGPVFFHRFWGNVVRHLARTRLFAGDKRFRLTSNRSEYRQGDRVTLTAYVKDRSFRPSTHDEQEIVLRSPGPAGRDERVRLRRTEPGVFERSFVAVELGDYQAWIVPEEGLSDEKISPVSFRVEVSDVERREPVLDEAALQLVARRTGGTYVRLPDARELIEKVGRETVEIPRQRRFMHLRDEGSGLLWSLPIVFLGLVTAEWILRKRFRLL